VQGLMGRADETGTSMRNAAVHYARENAGCLVAEYGGVVAHRDLFTPEQARPADRTAAGTTTAPPPNGAAPDPAGLTEAPLEAGWQAADAVPAYWPGPAE